MKYIDADKLIAEIERQKKHSQEAKMEFIDTGYNQNAFAEDCRLRSFDKLLSFITSLQQEQPEVVLTDNASFTKELKRFLFDTGNEKKRGGVMLPIIKHFYELGLNAKKEE